MGIADPVTSSHDPSGKKPRSAHSLRSAAAARNPSQKRKKMESVAVDEMSESIIPGLPNDLALRCLAMISHGYHGLLECVSKRWKHAIRSKDYAHLKARGGWSGDWLFVLGSNNPAMWLAYDPDADRWHPLPQMPGSTDDEEFCRFSCATTCDKFMVIGGCYIPRSTVWSETNLSEVNSVTVFDPFKKQWNSAASMSTKRIDFACAAIGEKVYVAGGRNLDNLQGLASAQVYDPCLDLWEDLPSMPFALIDCFSISHGGEFHVVGTKIHNFRQDAYVIFNPLTWKWRVMENFEPICELSRHSTTVLGSSIYRIFADGTVTVMTTDQMVWHELCAYPPVVLRGHNRQLRSFGFGFAASRKHIYVVGGLTLKYNTNNFTYVTIKLKTSKFCDITTLPLEWKDVKSMPIEVGHICGCAFLEEQS